jgi:hypothetical protein
VVVVVVMVVIVVMTMIVPVFALLTFGEIAVRRQRVGVRQVLLPFGEVPAPEVVRRSVLGLLSLGEVTPVLRLGGRVLLLAGTEAPLRIVVVPH